METILPSSALSLYEQRLQYSHELAEYSYRQLLIAQQEYSTAEAIRQAQRQAQRRQVLGGDDNSKIYSKNGGAPATPEVSTLHQSQHRQGQKWGCGSKSPGEIGVVGKVGRAIVRAVDYAGHAHGNSRSSSNTPNKGDNKGGT